jgi:hypothetical protein
MKSLPSAMLVKPSGPMESGYHLGKTVVQVLLEDGRYVIETVGLGKG